MGLIDKARETRPGPQAAGGLLKRTLQQGAGAAKTINAPQPVDATAVAAPQLAAATSPLDGLSSELARIEAGIDSAPLAFELLSRALGLSSAVLYLADYSRGSLVPCALCGVTGAPTIAVTAPIEQYFADARPRRLDPSMAKNLLPAAGSHEQTIWARPYSSKGTPTGLLVFSRPGPSLSDDVLRSALDNPEIGALLSASTEQLTAFPPLSLASLDRITPAGPSMLLTVSCDETASALAALAPSAHGPWLMDSLQRVLATLLAPLGKVGVRAGSVIALLTGRSIDIEVLTHQVSRRLGRLFRSARRRQGALVKIA
jgi:hypothetical protein